MIIVQLLKYHKTFNLCDVYYNQVNMSYHISLTFDLY